MRLFVALDLDEDIRARIARFLDGVRGFAPDARWVRPESLHVTLKFIGEESENELEKIKQSLGMIEAQAFAMNIRGIGFFPSAGAPRVFWIGVESDQNLSSLATAVDESLAVLNIPKEEHGFSPHLTLARAGGSRSPRKHKSADATRGFKQLQEKLSVLPIREFGTMTPREFCLFHSQLSSSGSKYTKLARFALR